MTNVTSYRVYKTDKGANLIAERHNPYGLIFVRTDKGQVPESLKGSFTDYEQADLAISTYLNKKQKVVTEIKTENSEF